MIKVLFCAWGNICRSPTADGVLRKKSKPQALPIKWKSIPLAHQLAYWQSPDARSQQAAAKRGYDLSLLRARQVSPSDFTEFDYVLAMDYDNLSDLKPLSLRKRAQNRSCFKTFGSDNLQQRSA